MILTRERMYYFMMHYGCIYGCTCNHTSPGPPHPASSPPGPWPGKLLQQSVCITNEFLHKLSETVSGKLICMLVVFIWFSTWLQFVVVTNLSWQILTFVGIWHFGEVFSSRVNPGLLEVLMVVWRGVQGRCGVFVFFKSAIELIQIKSNQITFIITSPQHKCLGEWNSWERAPDSAETIYI